MERLTIHTHGITKGDPGPAAISVLVNDEKGQEILQLSQAIGNATQNFAQYFAVVRAFQILKEKFGQQTQKMQFELVLDNKLIFDHLRAEAEIKDVGLIGHFIEIYNLRVSNFSNLEITLMKNSKKEVVDLSVKAFDE